MFVPALFAFACTTAPTDTVERIPEVEALMKKMSVEQKVGQTAQLTLDVITEGDNIFSSHEPVQMNIELLDKAIHKYHVGSILNTANNRARTPEKWNELIADIEVSTSITELQIPVLYGVDAIHGATYTDGATFFPQQIAQAASWNRQVPFNGAKVTAYELGACNIPWNFSPVLDLGCDPRWPRIWETFGEDPYLVSEMGVQVIKGYQGDDLKDPTTVAACLKHFLGYSAARSGKDRTPAELSEVSLREYHLPSFQAAIEAGAASIMVNSGLINGTPVHASYEILTTMLKEELGFNGLVVTDWADIENLHNRDKVATSHKEAIKMAINAGIDMSMVPYGYEQYCELFVELVNEGEVSMSRLDDAVRRILNLKYKLGLFDARDHAITNYPKFGCDEFERLAYNAAAEAITLLKNQSQILPLKRGTKILVTGPNANSMRTLNGGWSYSWQGEKVEEFADEYNTIYEALNNEFGSSNVSFVPGVEYKMDGTYDEDRIVDVKAATRAALKADVVVLCLGENTYTEKPGDLHDLSLSVNQVALAKAVAKAGKPVVLVLNEGRPRIIREIEPLADAVIQTYYSGNFAGDALADILSGDVNPSGKLPYTYPMFVNSLGVYNHKPSEESKTPEGMYNYGGGFFPQYQFGHGLSYTTFEYENLQISQSTFTTADELTIQVDVKNSGSVAGKEVVQLYTADRYASITPDVKRLRGFEKIELQAGETKTVSFTISSESLSFINAAGERITEAGVFDVMIADQSVQITLQ